MVGDEGARVEVPEQPVVGDNELRPGIGRLPEEIEVGGHACSHYRHLARSRHLQAIWPVVWEIRGLEQLVEIGDDFVQVRHLCRTIFRIALTGVHLRDLRSFSAGMHT